MKRHHRRWSVPAIAGASVLALTSPSTAQAAAPSGVSAPAHSSAADRVPAGTHTVTLITGDVVTTSQIARGEGPSGGTVTVRGADGLPARTRILTSNDDLYVYPESVLPFLAQGTLDRQLFNITDLIADGYDDAHRDRLPLIVSYTQAGAARHASAVPEGAKRVRSLDSIQGAALSADRSRADDFWESVAGAATDDGARAKDAKPSFGAGISHIWLDAPIHADLADSTAQIGAPQVWQSGDTGQGVDVAVLDSGVDAGHPDLADRIVTRQNFVPEEDDTDDRAGHGTHVASIIAGTGAASGGKEKGVAPGARLRIGKVLDRTGSGQISFALAGMEWAAVDQHAKIINMSLGAGVSDGTDPMSLAVDRLSAQTGALFVVAAGNAGAPDSISTPGTAASALTVGAVDSDDALAPFSSRGPRIDGALKPEITAPGVDILAANSRFVGNDQGSYQSMSGTSMATPHVAGAAALLAAAHPELTGSRLKDLLASSSRQTPAYDAFEAGSGRLDVAAAATAGVFASATAYAAQDEDEGALRRPVTYTNITDAPVALTLSVDAPQAPAGMFLLSASRVVVPAHGTAEVTVAIDGSAGTAENHYSGQVLATDSAGSAVAHTAVSLGFATMHTLTLTFKDSEGDPTFGDVWLLRAGDKDPLLIGVGPSGTGEFLVPDDVYSVLSFQEVQGVGGPHSRGLALLGDPDVMVDRDTTVTFDATKAERIDMTTPQRSDVTFQKLGYNRVMNGVRSGLSADSVYYDSIWAQPTTHKVTHGDFRLTARWRGEKPALAVSTRTTEFTGILRQEGITPLATGTYKLPLVFAGQGSSTEYAGLDARGKAVVVRHSDDGVNEFDQAANAIAAGAKLMLVVESGYGRPLRSYAPLGERPIPLDVGLLGTEEGEELIRQVKGGAAKVTVDSETASPYVYDLAHAWHNEIPSKMAVKGDTKNLARIDVDFASPKHDVAAGEFRFEWLDGVDWSSGPLMPEPANGKRTDWVSTTGVSWHQQAYVQYLGFEEGAKAAYRAGSRQSEEWFKPIQRPFLNDTFFNNLPPSRNGDQLYIDIPAWGSRDHVGWNQDPAGTQQQTLYQGTEQLGQGSFTTVWGDAPSARKLPYKLVVTGERDVPYTPYSSRTRTEWDFTSAKPTDAVTVVLPLVQLDYRIGTDAAGRAGRHDGLSVTAAHLSGASLAGKIGAVGLELSYDDGRTWHKAARGSDGRFRLDAPGKASFVSLRASAKDSAGNSVKQTVIRAFGLR
ncbi:S8 family serine peptidase [Actinacidiphila glaucinigra]